MFVFSCTRHKGKFWKWKLKVSSENVLMIHKYMNIHLPWWVQQIGKRVFNNLEFYHVLKFNRNKSTPFIFQFKIFVRMKEDNIFFKCFTWIGKKGSVFLKIYILGNHIINIKNVHIHRIQDKLLFFNRLFIF